MIPIIQNFDSYILTYIKNNMQSIFMDRSMVIITSLGNIGLLWIFIALGLIISKKYRKIGIMTIAALILTSILGEGIIKHLVQRIRPCANIQTINMLITKPLSYSFPSGHTASSFAAAGILAKYFKDSSFEFFILAFLVAFSRLYLYVHYPSDILGGIILGLICAKVVLWIFEKNFLQNLFIQKRSD